MARPNMTICRFVKLTSPEAISGSAAHLTRSDHALNADPERSHLNRIVIGGSHPVAEIEAKLSGLWSRTNSVLAIEVVLSASPEWWVDAGPDLVEDWVRANVRFLDQTFGKENVVHLRLHLDETTPHLTGYIVPVVNGRLNAKSFLGGKVKMRSLQDKAAEAVAHLGLNRGVKGSQASHVSLKKFYATLSGKVETPDPEILPMIVALAKSSNDNAQRQRRQPLDYALSTLRRSLSLPASIVLHGIGNAGWIRRIALPSR